MAFGANPQIEADRRLLQFPQYEDYLDSLVTFQDRCYLQNIQVGRLFAELGYRSCGETLSRQQFEERRNAVIKFLHPVTTAYELASEKFTSGDRLLKELATRERQNRLGLLSTIIFLRYITKAGFEISGYIDFADRLNKENWEPIFLGQKKICPNSLDLGYYHWKNNSTTTNDSANYKVVVDIHHGLLFQNRFDRKLVNVNPASDPGQNTKRVRVFSQLYYHVMIFDHMVRQRI